MSVSAFSTLPSDVHDDPLVFNRIATFPICSQIDPECNTDVETVAEIVAVTDDGMMAVYGDSALGAVGMVDISDAAHPKGLGSVDVGGEPTSVAVVGGYVLASVNTSPNFLSPSGVLKVISIDSASVVAELALDGQPDAIAVSPDKMYAVIAIENERDEDLGEGVLPQMPAGHVEIVTMSGAPSAWTKKVVDLTGALAAAGVHGASDPEPEFVSINSYNHAVVTLQENNAIVIIDVPTATVASAFDLGSVDLTKVDTAEDGLIKQSASLSAVPREPDGVTWIGDQYFATADEGDMDGGSRGFTIFHADGAVAYSSGSMMEHMVAKVGHYPDERSENKGNEPENVFFGSFGGEDLLFVNSERSSLVFVFNVNDPTQPQFLQVLPAGVAPEGGVAVPSRGLIIVACEDDARDDKMRSSLMIYAQEHAVPQYPTIASALRADGTPIPFSALSGLAAGEGRMLYSIEDSFYKSNRIFEIDATHSPATLTREITIKDTFGALGALPLWSSPTAVADSDDSFTAEDRAAMINADGSVNIDPEGIALGYLYGGYKFVVASEGSGTIGDPTRDLKTPDLLFVCQMDGAIERVIALPDDVNHMQLRFGFEGVAIDGSTIVVAFQRAWGSEEHPRLGLYDTATEAWTFVMYPLDAVESPNGGWVGLSDIAPLGNMEFLVLERDNQGATDKRIARVYQISLAGVAAGAPVTKHLVKDLMPDMKALNGFVFEKVEGLTVTQDGFMWVVNDNDGVDDNSGEIQLMQFPPDKWHAGRRRKVMRTLRK